MVVGSLSGQCVSRSRQLASHFAVGRCNLGIGKLSVLGE